MTKRKRSTDCRQLFSRLSEYLDGEMPPGLCEELRAHLDRCTSCEAFAGTLKRIVDLCRALPPLSLSDDVRAELKSVLAHREHRGNMFRALGSFQ